MKKKFLSDFFFIQVINLIIKPVWILIIDRKVQNMLPAAEYGTYFSLTGYSLIFMILLDLGLTNYNNREVAIDKQFYKSNFWSLMGAKGILTLVFFVLAFFVGWLMGFTSRDFYIFSLLAINQTLLSFNTFLRSNISAIHNFKLDGILSVIDRAFVVLSLGVIIWTGFTSIELNIYTFILAQTAGLFLTFLMTLLANFKYLGRADLTFNFAKVTQLLGQSLPFAVIIALMTLYTRLDSVLILKILPDGRAEAGNYAMSYRLLDAASIFGILLAGQLMPLFSSNLMNKPRLYTIVRWAMLLVWLPALIATLVCSVWSTPIMQFLYPEKFQLNSGFVFGVLIWSIDRKSVV